MSSDSLETPIYSSFSADPDFGELVEMFVSELPDRIEQMQDAFESSDWELVQRCAHQLKGALGSYGFESLSDPAAALETATRESSPEEVILKRLNDLAELCQRCRSGSPE